MASSPKAGQVGVLKKGVVNATSTFINAFLSMKAGKADSRVMKQLKPETKKYFAVL